MATESPDEFRPRAGGSLLSDVLIGGGMGLLLALVWVLLLVLAGLLEARPGLSLRGCLLVLGLICVVAVGVSAG